MLAGAMGLFQHRGNPKGPGGNPEPARNPFGKSSGGSGRLSRKRPEVFGHRRPLGVSRHTLYRQPPGYYFQPVKKNHIHSYGPASPTLQTRRPKRPIFA
jgi:hypothetical protein